MLIDLLNTVFPEYAQMEELAKACETGSFTQEKKFEYERLMLNELDKMVRQSGKRALA